MKSTLIRILSGLIALAMLMSMCAVAEDVVQEEVVEFIAEEEIAAVAEELPGETVEEVQEIEEIVETESGTAVEENVAEAPAIAYDQDAGMSPAFTSGYAQVLNEAVVFSSLSDDADWYTITSGVVYVISRDGADMEIAYNYNGEIATGWTHPALVRPMSPEEVAAYIVSVEDGVTYGDVVLAPVAGDEAVSAAAELSVSWPVGDVYVAEGEIAGVTIEATGEGVTYQWYIKNPGKTSFSKSSITKNTYNVTMTAAISGRQIYCVVSDSAGNEITTPTYTLYILETLEIVQQPVDTYAAVGEIASVVVQATGTDLSYTWYVKNPGKTSFSKSSIKKNTYSVTMSEAIDGRQIYCMISDAAGNYVVSDVVTLSIGSAGLEITQQPASVEVEEGAYAQSTIIAVGEGLTYTWYVKNPAATNFVKSSITRNTYSVKMTAAINGRQIYCVVTDANGQSVQSEVATLTMASSIPGPEITQQPASVEVEEGAYAQSTIIAVGEGLTYTWYVKNPAGANFVKSSITRNTYSVKMTAAINGRQIYCVVTDANGQSVQSEIATLTMASSIAGPEITQQPASVEVEEGAYAQSTIIAVGEGLTYTWYVKNPAATNFVKSSITRNTYSVKMTAAINGRQIYCVVTDANGQSVQSEIATLTMASSIAGPEITQQPASVEVEEGAYAQSTIIAVGEGLTYTWYVKNPAATNFVKSSITRNTYSVKMTAAINGRQIYCVVTDANGQSVQSEIATLTMAETASGPEITQQPEDVYAAEGELARVTVQATGVGLTYAWYVKNPGKTNYSKSSITKNTYTVTMSAAIDGRQIYCVVTDVAGNSVTSDVVTLNIVAPLAITQQPSTTYVAEGETAFATVEAIGTGLSYRWFVRNSGEAEFIESPVTDSTYSVTMTYANDGCEVYCKITDVVGNTIDSDIAQLNIVVPLGILRQPVTTYVAEGETAFAAVEATGTGLSYRWFVRNSGEAEFIESPVTDSTYSVTMTYANDGCEVYCKVTDVVGNTINSDIAQLNIVVPLGILRQPVTTYVAEGETAFAAVEAIGTGLTYRWFVKNPGEINFHETPVTTNTYSVTMEAWNDGCEIYCKVTDVVGNTLDSDIAQLNIVAPLAITQQPSTTYVAEGETAFATVEATGTGLSYQWYVKNPSDFDYHETEITESTYSVTMEAWNDGCEVYCKVTDVVGNTVDSEIAELNILEPLVITQQPVDAYATAGGTASAMVEATGTGLTYRWYVKNPGETEFNETPVTMNTYSVQMTEWNGGCEIYCKVIDVVGNTVNSDTVTLNIVVPPVFTLQPVDAYVSAGEMASATVEAIGTGLTYRWYVKNPGEYNFHETPITENTYSVTMEAWNDGCEVYCRVTDIVGNATDSEIASLNIMVPLEITRQPEDVTAPAGENVEITVEAQGRELTYSWYIKYSGDTEFSETSVTGSTYAVVVSAETDGCQLYCIITDAFGSTLQSDTVTVTMTEFTYEVNAAGTGAIVTGYFGDAASVTVPDTFEDLPVVEIGASAFEGNTTMTKIHLPSTVQVIGAAAFKNCTSLCEMD